MGFGHSGGGGAENAALQKQIAQENAQQNQILAQEKAQEEQQSQALEAQRIAALRGRFGGGAASDQASTIQAVPSQNVPMSTASLYSI